MRTVAGSKTRDRPRAPSASGRGRAGRGGPRASPVIRWTASSSPSSPPRARTGRGSAGMSRTPRAGLVRDERRRSRPSLRVAEEPRMPSVRARRDLVDARGPRRAGGRRARRPRRRRVSRMTSPSVRPSQARCSGLVKAPRRSASHERSPANRRPRACISARIRSRADAVGEARLQGPDAARLDPRRQHDQQARARPLVGVQVEGDVEALGPRVVDEAEHRSGGPGNVARW